MKSNDRGHFMLGGLLLIAGSVLLVLSTRVLSTFLLDVVVQALLPGESPEPYDFSWGTMEWGRSARDFTMLCAGFASLTIGQILIIPRTIRRLRSAGIGSLKSLPGLALVGASALSILAAGSFVLIPIFTKQALGVLSLTGAADPVSLAEDLPVLSSRVFMASLVAAQILILLAVCRLPEPEAKSDNSSAGSVAAWTSGFCLLVCAVLLVIIRLGPIAVFATIGSSGGLADPTALAAEITQAIQLLFVCGALIGLSAILMSVAVLIPRK
jgi:hypothetical protein